MTKDKTKAAFIKAEAAWLRLVRAGEEEWVRMRAEHDKIAAKIAKAKVKLDAARQAYWQTLPP